MDFPPLLYFILITLTISLLQLTDGQAAHQWIKLWFPASENCNNDPQYESTDSNIVTIPEGTDYLSVQQNGLWRMGVYGSLLFDNVTCRRIELLGSVNSLSVLRYGDAYQNEASIHFYPDINLLGTPTVINQDGLLDGEIAFQSLFFTGNHSWFISNSFGTVCLKPNKNVYENGFDITLEGTPDNKIINSVQYDCFESTDTPYTQTTTYSATSDTPGTTEFTTEFIITDTTPQTDTTTEFISTETETTPQADTTTEIISTETETTLTTESDNETTKADTTTEFISTDNISTEPPTSAPTTTTTTRPIENGDRICKGSDIYGRIWQALAGSLARMPCPNSNDNGESTWQCNFEGSFVGLPIFNCVTPWISEAISEIKNATSFTVDQAVNITAKISDTIQAALEASKSSTSGAKGEAEIYGSELFVLLDALLELVNKTTPVEMTSLFLRSEETKQEPLSELKQLFYANIKIVDDVLRYNKTWKQLEQKGKDEIFTQLLNLTDNSSSMLALKVTENDIGCNLRQSNCSPVTVVETKYVAVEATAGYVQNNEINFPRNSKRIKGQDTFIKLPQMKGHKEKVPFTAFTIRSTEVQQAVLGQSRDASDDIELVVNGDMISLSVYNLNSSDMTMTKRSLEETDPVEITFKNDRECWSYKKRVLHRRLHENNGERARGVKSGAFCSYWDISLNIWSSAGCTLISKSEFSATCRCSHLTSFNILTQLHIYDGKSTALLITTIIVGCYIASQSLIDILPNKAVQISQLDNETKKDILFRKSPQIVQKYMQFLFTLAYGSILFFVDKHFFYWKDKWCYVTGLFVHLLLLVLLSTMAFESFMLIWNVKQLNKKEENETSKWRKGWKQFTHDSPAFSRMIVPAAFSVTIVGFTVSLDAITGVNTRAYGGDFCFLDGNFIWAYFGPLVCIVGVVLFTCIIIYGYTKEKNSQILELLRQTMINFVVLGCTWFIGFFQYGKYYTENEALAYAFLVFVTIHCFMLSKFGSPLQQQTEGRIMKTMNYLWSTATDKVTITPKQPNSGNVIKAVTLNNRSYSEHSTA